MDIWITLYMDLCHHVITTPMDCLTNRNSIITGSFYKTIVSRTDTPEQGIGLHLDCDILEYMWYFLDIVVWNISRLDIYRLYWALTDMYGMSISCAVYIVLRDQSGNIFVEFIKGNEIYTSVVGYLFALSELHRG